MSRLPEAASEDRVESLTRNLLECYEELDLIYRVSHELLANPGIQEIVGIILAEAMEIFEADQGWVVPADPAAGVFDPVREQVSDHTFSLLNAAVVLPQLGRGKSRMFYRLQKELNLTEGEIPDTFLCALIQTEDAAYGALCLGRLAGRGVFTAGDLKLGDALVSQAAVAIENATLHQQRLREEQARIRMEEELRLARSIQKKLLPTVAPKIEGYEIAGRSLPARSVGGDYYDFVCMEDGRIAFCLGDVSGKGMPAALLMAHLQAAVRSQTLMQAPPARCLDHSNILLFESTDTERFATCFYGILDPRHHRLAYANAGHEHPLIVSSGGKRSSLEAGGIVLGILGDATYQEAAAEIHPGEILVLYSDGITDASDTQEREFGLERLLGTIQENQARGAEEILEAVLAAVTAHAGEAEQTDDMTLVVIRRFP